MLTTGNYSPVTDKTVYVWKEPDADGDGAQVTRQRQDPAGNNIGQENVMDHGKPVRHYKAPDGFREIRGYDGTVTAVLHDVDGNMVRNAHGEAVNIYPGQAVVLHADGSSQVLNGEYERYLFERAHQPAGKAVPVGVHSQDTQTVNDVEDSSDTSEYDEFLAWKAANKNKGE